MENNFYKKREVLSGIVLILLGIILSSGSFYYFIFRNQQNNSVTKSITTNKTSTTSVAKIVSKNTITQPVATTSLVVASWCEVDFSEAPLMASLAGIIDQVCEENYIKIKEKLDNASPTEKILITFKKYQDSSGETSGNKINLSVEWFSQNPNDLGAIVHEIVHVVQSYPDYIFWPTEGIADYLRYWSGYQNSWSYAHCNRDSPKYDSGYWCSAAFLQYIEKRYDSNIIFRLNAALRGGDYSDSLFLNYTGKNILQLWQECLSVDCQGGTP